MSEPAFPINELDDSGNHHHSHLGISIHTYFAAEAMKGLLSKGQFDYTPLCQTHISSVVKDSYAMADAMLEARK